MKRLIAVCLTVVFFISASSFSLSIGSKKKVEVVFTNTLTYADLIRIKQDLDAKGISIDYTQLEFDKKKKLKRIAFSVDCKDGFSGKASTSHFSKEKKFGFYRDYDEDAKVLFFAGNF